MMIELLEMLKPILWVVIIFGILIAISFLAIFISIIAFIIKRIKGDTDD